MSKSKCKSERNSQSNGDSMSDSNSDCDSKSNSESECKSKWESKRTSDNGHHTALLKKRREGYHTQKNRFSYKWTPRFTDYGQKKCAEKMQSLLTDILLKKDKRKCADYHFIAYGCLFKTVLLDEPGY